MKDTMRQKQKLTITVDADLLPVAKRYGRFRGVSLSSLIEQSLREMAGENTPSFASCWRGRFRAAEREDDPRYDAHAPGRLRSGRPYRGENSQHLPAIYPPQGCGAQRRHCVTLQCLHPAGDVLGVAPTGPVRLMHRTGGFPEGRHRRCVPIGQGVATLRNGCPVLRRLLAG